MQTEIKNTFEFGVRIILLLLLFLLSGCVAPLATSTSIALTPSAVPPVDEAATGPLFVNPDNPRYFTDGTKVDGKYRSIYLSGSSFWDVLQDSGTTSQLPYVLDYSGWLNFLASYNHNFFRLYMWEQAKGVAETTTPYYWQPTIYMRTGPGNALDGGPKFDLTRFNQAYFDRMRARTIEAGDRGMYVGVMLFNGWSVDPKNFPGGAGQNSPWQGHPLHVENNINGINGDTNGDQSGIESEDLSIPAVTALQEAYVRKVIDTVGDLDNVLYEICNECADGSYQSSDSAQWQYHMIDLIHAYEASKPKQHPVGITHFREDSLLFNSNAEWVSIYESGSLESPLVADGSKVILLDTDHICGICGDRQWVWKSFTRGKNLIFMDQYDDSYRLNGGGYNQNNPNDVSLRQNLGYTRSYANRMNLTAMTPQPNLCSTSYCLANPAEEGAAYLIYLPAGAELAELLARLGIDKQPPIYLPTDGQVRVDLSAASGEMAVEWFNPANGETVQGEPVTGGVSQTFTAPFTGDAVLYIYDTTP